MRKVIPGRGDTCKNLCDMREDKSSSIFLFILRTAPKLGAEQQASMRMLSDMMMEEIVGLVYKN